MKEERLLEPEEDCPGERAACQEPGPADATGRSPETQYLGFALLPSQIPTCSYCAKTTREGQDGREPIHVAPTGQLVEHREGGEGWRADLEGQTENMQPYNKLTRPLP